MKPIRVLMSFLGFLFLLSPLVSIAAKQSAVHPAILTVSFILGAVVLKASFPKKYVNATMAGVEVDMWANYIIERFWKDNTFLQKVFNDSQYVLSGKVVHIPQVGASPAVVKNRNVFPAVAVKRADTDVTYALDVYTTDPAHIEDAEKYEVSYDKINSVFGDHAGAVSEAVAEDMIVKWLTGLSAGAKMVTSGADALATAPDATGTVKLMTAADVRRAMTKFNADNVPKADRYVMPSANMLDHLIQSMSDTQYKDFSSYMDAKNGVIGKLFTFTFLDRSTTAITNAGAVKPVGAVGAVADAEATLFWQKDSLAAALGDVKFFDNVNDPQYYGDVYSALLRAGGRRRRADDKGVLQMSQR